MKKNTLQTNTPPNDMKKDINTSANLSRDRRWGKRVLILLTLLLATSSLSAQNFARRGFAFGADRAHRVASEEEIKVSLNWLGKKQQTAGHCPRCGLPLEGFERQAVSRYADVAICSRCGSEEALEQAGFARKKPLTAWWCTGDWTL